MTKKNKNPIWVADEYAALPAHIANRALLAVLWAKPKKAKRIYKELLAQRDAEAFMHVPDPERPVQFVMPRSLVGPREVVEASEKAKAAADWHAVLQDFIATEAETVRPAPNKYFCVQETAPWGNGDNVAEFEKMPDGGFHVAATNRSGEEFADINMTAEQFAAFKQWVMEN